jgi:hypothetical protein
MASAQLPPQLGERAGLGSGVIRGQADQEKLCEQLLTTLAELVRRREEDANRARDHRAARERVHAAARDKMQAEASAEAKHTGRTAPSYHQLQLAKRQLQDAEESLVKSMKALERRHALSQPHDEDLRATRVVLHAAQDLKRSLQEMQSLRSDRELVQKQQKQLDGLRRDLEASRARVAELEAANEAALQRVNALERDAKEAQATIDQLKAWLAESESNCAPLYELVPKLRQQNDTLRAQLRDHVAAAEQWDAEREELERQIASVARGKAESEAEALRLQQELARNEASAARELAEREAELHRFYALQLQEAERAAGEPEEQANMANQLHTLRVQLHESVAAKDAAEQRAAAAESWVQKAEQDLAARSAADGNASTEGDNGDTRATHKADSDTVAAQHQQSPLSPPEGRQHVDERGETENSAGSAVLPSDSLTTSIADERKQLTALKERVLTRDRQRAQQGASTSAGADDTQSPSVVRFTRGHHTCVKLSADGTEATKRDDGGLDNGTSRTAAGSGLPRKGRHFAEFTILRGTDVRVGVIRPGWDVEAGGDAWAAHGHCLYHVGNGARCPGQKEWEGRQRAQKGDRIGLLLDLDQGCMSIYKNGSRLGLLQHSGLSGQFCWAATLHNEDDAVHIQGNPMPTYAVPETLGKGHPEAEDEHDDPFRDSEDGKDDSVPFPPEPQGARQSPPRNGRFSPRQHPGGPPARSNQASVARQQKPKPKPPPPPPQHQHHDRLESIETTRQLSQVPTNASPVEGWGIAAGTMRNGYVGATWPHEVVGVGYPERQRAGFEDFSSLAGAGAGGNTTAAGQKTLSQQQRAFAVASSGADPTSTGDCSTYTAGPSVPAHTGSQNGASHVYLNPNSAWVQQADSGGEPWYYNSETAEVTFSPPREGVRPAVD